MKVKYRPAAINDIEETTNYLAVNLNNVNAAKKLRTRILHAISLLKDNPLMGVQMENQLKGNESNIRFLIVDRQIVFYEIDLENDFVEVVRILDSRTDYLVTLFG